MRRKRHSCPRFLALPTTAALLVLLAAPAAAQTVPTTPEPVPAEEGQPPISSEDRPKGRVMAEAATALGVLRLLPEAMDAEAVMPGGERGQPKQSALEGGFGLSYARADSESYLSHERSVAEAAPFGLSVAGHTPQAPGSAVQTALPDNDKALSTGLEAPDNPLVGLSALRGRAHARWSETMGPCVGIVADAGTSVMGLSLVNAIPTMPDSNQAAKAGGELAAALEEMPGSLANLGGLLSGQQSEGDGSGSLVSVDKALSTRSVVRLVDVEGDDGGTRKAVEAVSTLQGGRIDILRGTPLGLTVKVASQPTLRVLSTGDAETSVVDYTAPVLTVERNGRTLFRLDAANPTADIPVGIPLPELKDLPGYEDVKETPVIGDVAEQVDGGITTLSERAAERVLDIGVLRLSIAELDEKAQTVTEPFAGHQVSAVARLLDVRVLPTDRLRKLLPDDLSTELPSALVQVSLGEQSASAYAPEGGVDCSEPVEPAAPTEPAAPPVADDRPDVPAALAHTNAAYSTVPLFWTGTALLLVGVVLVAALPNRPLRAPAQVRPSPHPRGK
ncbi:hypothetical protein [Saccharomonospora cyanea]|uniref:Uncharacterized protein n=1 Tax=Saccharomonospora cyanea NA-134 TaxID=882082 RepID=H5XK81_9PSEU|nr:hypothetical protein [Saccharomonospora cyanea]EHR63516.1 hypothetical protein SaccyDRAFT_4710 [Saccharomonospora cyanea NA-134]